MQPRPAMENQDDMGPLDKLVAFAREHPKLSVIGAAGIGLLGGAEIAAGVLIGAGVAALLHLELGGHSARGVRERARAVVDAMRGKNAPQEPRDVTSEPIDAPPI